MKVKNLFLPIVLCLPLTLSAQQTSDNETRDHAVYLEIGGGSLISGASYEQRFGKNSRWGVRAGVGFGYSSSSSFFMGSTSTRAWTVPVGVNYLVGSKKNSLEVGVGVSLGVYNLHYDELSYENVSEATFNDFLANPQKYPGNMISAYSDTSDPPTYTFGYRYGKSKNEFGYFFFGNIGYRHVAKSGFMFRVGITPTLNFGGNNAVYCGFGDDYNKVSAIPYIGFGWAF